MKCTIHISSQVKEQLHLYFDEYIQALRHYLSKDFPNIEFDFKYVDKHSQGTGSEINPPPCICNISFQFPATKGKDISEEILGVADKVALNLKKKFRDRRFHQSLDPEPFLTLDELLN
ncbi:hypothetical protein [Aggregatibacter sp. Marseille-P9115]|jgi:hypothetical protein|uniref:hypothetical protein n=1 Tax=Aggregatibacter sp. Marseille-P9115 TaxID=2866570 RepID=UPI001E35C394|nr:hypothetical protein [Aggregatibacter sp. Marseille-P9115]